MSESLRPHESQHARPPCPSPTSGVYSNSCPLSWWCHPAISSSVVPFSSCPQSLSASVSFPMSQLFAWGGQSIWVSDGLAGSPCSPRDSQESSPTPQFRSINFLVLSFLHSSTLTSIHDHWKNHSPLLFASNLSSVPSETQGPSLVNSPVSSESICFSFLPWWKSGWLSRRLFLSCRLL